MGKINGARFDFSGVINYFKRYGYDCYDAVFEACDEVSKETVKKLRQASAAEFGNGKYAKGWTRTLEKGRLRGYATVHGKKPTYSLAHLLEKGHVVKNGTRRIVGEAPAYPHIGNIAQEAEDEAIDRTIQKLEAVE